MFDENPVINQNLDFINNKDIESDFNILNKIFDKSEEPENNLFKKENKFTFPKINKCNLYNLYLL